MTFDANCKPSFQPCPHAEDGHPPEPAPSLDTCMDPPHSKDDSSPSSEAAAAQGLRNAAAPAAEGVDDREEGEVSGVADGWAIADADAVGQKRMRGRGDGERDDRCGAAQSGHWSDRGATADCEQGKSFTHLESEPSLICSCKLSTLFEGSPVLTLHQILL